MTLPNKPPVKPVETIPVKSEQHGPASNKPDEPSKLGQSFNPGSIPNEVPNQVKLVKIREVLKRISSDSHGVDSGMIAIKEILNF